MNDLTIFSRDGQLYTDSREVAEMIGKRHDHLVRDIDGYVEVMKESGEPKIGGSEFFIPSTYKVEGNNKSYPCYNITKKGCEFVANKLTSKKGIYLYRHLCECFPRYGGQARRKAAAQNDGYGFEESKDYSSFSEKSEKPSGGRPSTDHILTLDIPKHIAMILTL